ncbi:hypothetical protein D3C85_1471080 [compost metagenome]
MDKRHDAQAVEQMAGHHFVRIAHGGQVVGLVPLDQQGQVGQQLCLLGLAQLDTELAGACGQLFGVLRGDLRTQALCSNSRPAPRFFR